MSEREREVDELLREFQRQEPHRLQTLRDHVALWRDTPERSSLRRSLAIDEDEGAAIVDYVDLLLAQVEHEREARRSAEQWVLRLLPATRGSAMTSDVTEDMIEAARQAVLRVDGVLDITTDALEAAIQDAEAMRPPSHSITEELVAIRRLFVLILQKLGATEDEIALARVPVEGER